MRTFLFILAGAVGGAGLIFAIFPLIATYIVGPIHGEDQMSLNATIFLFGFPACVVAGALAGFFIARRRRNKRRQ